MAGKTIATLPRPSGTFSISEINSLFTEIASVLNNKVDLRGGSQLTEENFNCGVKQVINVPDPTADGDLVPLSYLQGLI